MLLREDNRVITNWYQKPTFSGRILNYNSNHLLHQKVGVIYSLIDKPILYSDKKFQSDNILFAKSVLKLNNYPSFFIEKYTKNVNIT